MQNQINDFTSDFLPHYLCDYRKTYNTHHALLAVIVKWKNNLDDKGFVGAVFMDLSKTVDTLNHDLLIAKLNEYGLQHNALKLIYKLPSKIKLNTTIRSWEEFT